MSDSAPADDTTNPLAVILKGRNPVFGSEKHLNILNAARQSGERTNPLLLSRHDDMSSVRDVDLM